MTSIFLMLILLLGIEVAKRFLYAWESKRPPFDEED